MQIFRKGEGIMECPICFNGFNLQYPRVQMGTALVKDAEIQYHLVDYAEEVLLR